MSQELKPDRTRIEDLEAQLADILYRLGEIETVKTLPAGTIIRHTPQGSQVIEPTGKRKRGRPRKHPIAEPDNAA